MASKFELRSPFFTSVARSFDRIATDVTKETTTPNVQGVVNGFYEYSAATATPNPAIQLYKFSPPSVDRFLGHYPSPEALEAGCRFIVANSFDPAQHNKDVEVSFKEDDGYVSTNYFPDTDSNDKKVRHVKPQTQVEFAITFRDDGTGKIKGFVSAYPSTTIPIGQ